MVFYYGMAPRHPHYEVDMAQRERYDEVFHEPTEAELEAEQLADEEEELETQMGATDNGDRPVDDYEYDGGPQ